MDKKVSMRDGGVYAFSSEKVSIGDGGVHAFSSGKVSMRDGGGPPVYVCQKGNKGPVIYWGTFLFQENTIEHLVEVLDQEVPEAEYVLVAFLAEDWNRDFSPWRAPAAFGTEDFGGEGARTLRWLTEVLDPVIEEKFGPERQKFLVGYSLAGLFALWVAYETAVFDGIASCSGSLWFKDWDAYVASHRVLKQCKVYLSLGGKEEKTRNQQMAKVGDRTREQEKMLMADERVTDCVLEWNSGGHFADSEKRLVKGIRWLLLGNQS